MPRPVPLGKLKQQVKINLLEEFKSQTKKDIRQGGRKFQRFLEAVARYNESRYGLDRVHRELASLMQEAMLSEYDTEVAALTKVPSYRQDAPGKARRFAGGKLRRALSSPSMVEGSIQGIGYINAGLLNRQAKQWRRLNFGAGSIAGPEGREYQLALGSKVFGKLRLSGSPYKPFTMPRSGYFFKEGFSGTRAGGKFKRARHGGRFAPSGYVPPGGQPAAFYYGSKGPLSGGLYGFKNPIPTRGIRGRHYLEAGLQVLEDRLGPAYEDLLAEWIRKAKEEVGPLKG